MSAASTHDPSSPGPPILDPERLTEVCGEDADFRRNLLEEFREQIPGLIETIRSAVTAADPAGLRSAAHTLKGCCRTVGADALAAAAASLEQLAKQGTTEGAQPLLGLVRAEQDRLEPEIGRLLAA